MGSGCICCCLADCRCLPTALPWRKCLALAHFATQAATARSRPENSPAGGPLEQLGLQRHWAIVRQPCHPLSALEVARRSLSQAQPAAEIPSLGGPSCPPCSCSPQSNYGLFYSQLSMRGGPEKHMSSPSTYAQFWETAQQPVPSRPDSKSPKEPLHTYMTVLCSGLLVYPALCMASRHLQTP